MSLLPIYPYLSVGCQVSDTGSAGWNRSRLQKSRT
jgi:hypothetical protein